LRINFCDWEKENSDCSFSVGASRSIVVLFGNWLVNKSCLLCIFFLQVWCCHTFCWAESSRWKCAQTTNILWQQLDWDNNSISSHGCPWMQEGMLILVFILLLIKQKKKISFDLLGLFWLASTAWTNVAILMNSHTSIASICETRISGSVPH